MPHTGYVVATCAYTFPHLTQRQVESLVSLLVDLREGECLPLPWVRGNFQSSSVRAALEIRGTLAQRLEEARRTYEPCRCKEKCSCASVVERVEVMERYERGCGEFEQIFARAEKKDREKEMRHDREAVGRLCAGLRKSRAYRQSIQLLAFTLAVCLVEDYRIREIVMGQSQ
jgi:hypothetical protein